MKPQSLLSEIVLLSERLADLLDREVEALRSGGPKAIAALQEEKAALVGAYEAQLAEFGRQRAGGAAPAAGRDAAVAAARRLDGAAARNARALEAARDVSRRLMDMIVRAATGEQAQARGYGCAAGAVRPLPAGRREAISIALDQRL